MATRESTIDFLLDQLQSLRGVRSRKMFGEYALYLDEKVVALVCDDQLFVKITAAGAALLGERYEEGAPYPGAKPWILVCADEIEDGERLAELLRTTSAALPLAAPKRKAAPKTKASTPAPAKTDVRAKTNASSGAAAKTKRTDRSATRSHVKRK